MYFENISPGSSDEPHPYLKHNFNIHFLYTLPAAVQLPRAYNG
jgi:hypothetical protein